MHDALCGHHALSRHDDDASDDRGDPRRVDARQRSLQLDGVFLIRWDYILDVRNFLQSFLHSKVECDLHHVILFQKEGLLAAAMLPRIRRPPPPHRRTVATRKTGRRRHCPRGRPTWPCPPSPSAPCRPLRRRRPLRSRPRRRWPPRHRRPRNTRLTSQTVTRGGSGRAPQTTGQVNEATNCTARKKTDERVIPHKWLSIKYVQTVAGRGVCRKVDVADVEREVSPP